MRKPFQTISLRTKLVAVIAVISAAASIPLLYLGYTDTYKHAVEAAREQFGSITRTLHEDLQISYLNTQALTVEKAAAEKSDIISELDAIEEWIVSNKLGEMDSMFKFMEQKWGFYMAVSNEWGEFLRISPVIGRIWRQNNKDFLGVPFRDYLRNANRYFYRDYYTFLHAETANGQPLSLLMVVRKVAGYTVVVMRNLNLLEEQYKGKQAQLQEFIADRVKTLNVQREMSVSVVTSSGAVIAHRGADPERLYDEHQEIYQAARKSGAAAGTVRTKNGNELYAVRYFRALDWYIQTSLPLKVIADPAGAYARKLAAMLIVLFLLTASGGIILVTRFLNPLDLLAHSAKKIEGVDFIDSKSNEQLRQITARLPVKRRDEIGQVSRAFSQMVEAIEKNVAALKTSLARQHNIEGELNAAREIQAGMLPASGNGFHAAGFESAAMMQAAKEVGGDFYDVQKLPDGRQALILGDVSGKGVSAALFMSVTLTLVRTALAEGLAPAAVMKKVNDQLSLNNPNCMFVTLWIGLFNPLTGRLDYANGGHCPPVVLPAQPGGSLRWLRDMSGPLVGVMDTAEFKNLTTELKPGETCLVFTDGVSEAMNEERILFGEKGIVSAVEDLMSTGITVTAQKLIDAMIAAVIEHRGATEQSDDITMLVFQRLKTEES